MKTYFQPIVDICCVSVEDLMTTTGPVANGGAYKNDDKGSAYNDLF